MLSSFWSRFVAETGIDGAYDAWAFGDPNDPKAATDLALLVRDGPKRATTGVLSEYAAEGEPLPQSGELSVILNGDGDPVCVIRNTEVEISAFGDVDPAYAWDEGEGDRSLGYWRAEHRAVFESVGLEINNDTELVLLRFELLWSPMV